MHGFLFGTDEGCWRTAKLTETFIEYTMKNLGFRCTTQQYRHITKAIDRQFIRRTSSSDSDDEDEDVPEDEAAHDLMAGHSMHIANLKYGLNSDLLRGLSAQAVSLFRKVSERWQFWLKLEARQPKEIRTIEMTGLPRTTTEQRCQSALEKLYGVGANFRSDEQRDAVHAIVNGDSPLVAVFPTGAGKSLLIMLPALLDKGKCTVVVVPLVALAKDLVRRCRKGGIDASQWAGNIQRQSTIIVVTSNLSVTTEFAKFASALSLEGRLSRIIYDEIHFVITTSSYRTEMRQLKDLQLPVQVIGLTATLPPNKEKQINEIMVFPECRYIRASSNRQNLVYFVVQTQEDGTTEDTIVHSVQICMKEMKAGSKILIYGRYISACQSLAQRLDAKVYHAKETDKDKYLREWEEGLSEVLVATGALGAGVDVKDVCMVIHNGEPWGMTEFQQESGRGGRGGEETECVIVMTVGQYEHLERVDPKGLKDEQEVMREFIITKECRRKVLTKYFDGRGLSCEETKSLLCDNCQASHAQTMEGRNKREAIEFERDQELKRRKYEERVTAQTQGIQMEGSRRAYLKRMTVYLRSVCPVCWLLNGEEGAGHLFESCNVLSELLGRAYKGFRHGITFAADACCFTCGLPGDMCEAYSDGRECKTVDVVTPLVLAGFFSEREVIRKMVGFEHKSVDAFGRWMGRKGHVHDYRCTHSFVVFDELVWLRKH